LAIFREIHQVQGFIDFDRGKFGLGLDTWTLNSTVFAPNADQLSVKRKIDMLTAGINYKF
jgi:hypothetical protein